MPRLLLALLLAGGWAHAEHLVFTTITWPNCPILVSSPERSPEFGFQSLLVRNDADKTLESVHLTVKWSVGQPDREEIVDGGHVYVALEPGESKRLDVFLCRIAALAQRAKSARQEVVWLKVFVESAEFSDGSRWSMDQASPGPQDSPVTAEPVK